MLDLSEFSGEKSKLFTPSSPRRENFRLSKRPAYLLNIESKKEQTKGSSNKNQAEQPSKFNKIFLYSPDSNTSPFAKCPKLCTPLAKTESFAKQDSGYLTLTKKTADKNFNYERKHGKFLFNSQTNHTSNGVPFNNAFDYSDGYFSFSPKGSNLNSEMEPDRKVVPIKFKLDSDVELRDTSLTTENPNKTTTNKKEPDSCDSSEVAQKSTSLHFFEVSKEEAEKLLLSSNCHTPTTAANLQSLSVSVESIAESLSHEKVCPQVPRTNRRNKFNMGKAVQVSRCEEKNNRLLQHSKSGHIRFSYFNSFNPKAIGNGCFATTYRAESREFGRHAVKRIVKHESQLRIKKDVHNHEELGRHPNVAEFYRAFTEDGALFIQMELGLTSCKSLEVYFSACNANCNSQWVLLSDCCKGLLRMHSYKIVHLDVKPDNIILGSDWNFKLCDFGCSAKNKEEFVLGEHVDNEYEAPELRGNTVTNKSDVYALGQCIIYLTNGTVYMKDEDLFEVVAEMKDGNYTKRPNASDILKNEIVASKDVDQFRNDIQVTLEDAIEQNSNKHSEQKSKSIEQTPDIKAFCKVLSQKNLNTSTPKPSIATTLKCKKQLF